MNNPSHAVDLGYVVTSFCALCQWPGSIQIQCQSYRWVISHNFSHRWLSFSALCTTFRQASVFVRGRMPQFTWLTRSRVSWMPNLITQRDGTHLQASTFHFIASTRSAEAPLKYQPKMTAARSGTLMLIDCLSSQYSNWMYSSLLPTRPRGWHRCSANSPC